MDSEIILCLHIEREIMKISHQTRKHGPHDSHAKSTFSRGLVTGTMDDLRRWVCVSAASVPHLTTALRTERALLFWVPLPGH